MLQSNVLVFPSVWAETLGIVGLEALAHGVPVVASDVGGVREWLDDEKTGFLVPPKSPQAIASAIQQEADASAKTAEIVLMTHLAQESAVQQAIREIEALPVVKEIGNLIRVED